MCGPLSDVESSCISSTPSFEPSQLHNPLLVATNNLSCGNVTSLPVAHSATTTPCGICRGGYNQRGLLGGTKAHFPAKPRSIHCPAL